MGAAVESQPEAMVCVTADCSAIVNQGSDSGIRSTGEAGIRKKIQATKNF
jgi:hypothetical protein